MPIYEYQCDQCGAITEKIILSQKAPAIGINCPKCLEDEPEVNQKLGIGTAWKMLSVPASIRMGDGSARRRRERIKEPIWRYPDGHIEPVNP